MVVSDGFFPVKASVFGIGAASWPLFGPFQGSSNRYRLKRLSCSM